MVRILKVSHLEERRRVLVARSEICRRTLELEVENLKSATDLQLSRFSLLRASFRFLKTAAPLAAGLLSARKRAGQSKGEGFVSRLLSGIGIANDLVRRL